jgi:hypothetical protein
MIDRRFDNAISQNLAQCDVCRREIGDTLNIGLNMADKNYLRGDTWANLQFSGRLSPFLLHYSDGDPYWRWNGVGFHRRPRNLDGGDEQEFVHGSDRPSNHNM